MTTVKWMWLKFMMVPYTDKQLSVVIVACIIIGIYLGAMAVGAFKPHNENEYRN